MPVETRTVQQAYQFALQPTPAQGRAFLSHAGGARYVYNWALDQIAAALDLRSERKTAGIPDEQLPSIPGHFALCKSWTLHKNAHANDPAPAPGERATGTAWVGDNFVGTYQAAIRDAAAAWSNYFASRSGKRAGSRVGRPRYKSRHRSRVSFQVHGPTLRVPDAHHVTLPKIGTVKTHEATRKLLRRLRDGRARIVRGTVSLSSSGRWIIAITAEVQREIRTGPSARQLAGGPVGVDFGTRDLATLSTGETIPNPRYLEASLDRLAAAQRALSRTVKGSRNREKARRKVAAAHARIRAQRLDGLHKVTSALVHGHDRIAVEGFDVASLLRNGSKDLPRRVRRDRNRALADTGIGEARWQLQVKCGWYGATLVTADKRIPTGRTCSACGKVRTNPVPPRHELFHCPDCGQTQPRRLNTARLLHGLAVNAGDAASSAESLNGCGGDVRPGALRRDRRSPSKQLAGAGTLVPDKTGAPDP